MTAADRRLLRCQRRDQLQRGAGDTTNADLWMNVAFALIMTLAAAEVALAPQSIGGAVDRSDTAGVPSLIFYLSQMPGGEPVLRLSPDGPALPHADAVRAAISPPVSDVALTTPADTSAADIQWALITLREVGAADIRLGVRNPSQIEN